MMNENKMIAIVCASAFFAVAVAAITTQYQEAESNKAAMEKDTNK